MNISNLRSPHEKVGGLYHFGRMLDKIRLHAAGKLPADYIPNLGIGFDGRCASFLHIDYAALVARVAQGGSDEELLAWCYEQGRKPTDDEITFWNAFMSKLGWRDEASPRLQQRLLEYGFAGRTDIATFFDFLDADEGRL
jgi:gluconokinase